MNRFALRVPPCTLRGRVRLISLLALLGAPLPLVGCGGGSGTASVASPTAAQGRLALTVQWPARGRLVPAASGSIKAILMSGNSVVGQTLLVRPATAPWTTVATFDNLQPGPVKLTATAFPTATGGGTAQATGNASTEIVSGRQATLTVTMASTIDHVTITPPSATLNIGGIQQLTMTAYDSYGAVVLTAPQKVSWKSGTTGVATVDNSGSVTAASSGSSVITVTESESGKSATASILVTPPATSSTGPIRSVTDPDGKFLYVADYITKQIRPFAIGTNGALSPLTNAVITLSKPIYAMKAINTGIGKYLYVAIADSLGAQIFFYGISTDGSLVGQYPGSYISTRSPIALVGDPANKFLYCIDHDNGIRCYTVNPNGTLFQNGNDFTDGGYQFFAAAVSSDGKYLYVSAGQTGGIREEQINSDGTLTNIGSLSGYFANGMAMDPAAPYLYLATDTGVTGLQIQSDGKLVQAGPKISFSSNAYAAAVTPNGKNLYLVALNAPDNMVAQYAIQSDGSLTALTPATVPAGSYTTSVTVSPDGKSVYVTNNKANTVSQYRVNADGTLTPLSPSEVPG